MDQLRELSLFAGYGGATLGLDLVIPTRIVCAVERDAYCQRVLQARITDGSLPWFPIWDDVTTFDGRPWAGCVDIITAGFPCQDISCAGKQAGLEGERSGLFWEILRIAGECGAPLILLENVANIVSIDGGDAARAVVGALSTAGYDAQWLTIRASGVGAPHHRKRWFCLAYSKCDGWRADSKLLGNELSNQEWNAATQVAKDGKRFRDETARSGWDVADQQAERRRPGQATRPALWPAGYGPNQYDWEPPRLVPHAKRRNDSCGQMQGRDGRAGTPAAGCAGDGQAGGQTEPRVGRVPDGTPRRVDQLRCLGNGIVPQQLAAAVLSMLRKVS